MQSIDVSDLPEKTARALAEQAEFLRRQLAVKKKGSHKPHIEFAVRRDQVYGQLTQLPQFDG
ncbi:MAG: hypothetical protein U0587_04440 [Candidatus Binatia bacterium]